MAASDQFADRRQLGCIDISGRAAGRTGAGNTPWAGHRAAPNVVAAANAVVGEGVVDAMFWEPGDPTGPCGNACSPRSRRQRAGGQPDGERSAGSTW